MCFSWSRRVSVPSGTLVRVEGQALSLRCEVSDFEGPEEQDFDWKATRGAQTVNIISTWEPSFPEQALRGRVLSGDISVHRLGGSVVELRIREARVTDSATYTCSTPSTDATMRGNYDSDVQLRVIPNTLSLAPQVPVNLVTEGRSIRLHCNVSQNFTDGIYLSVTWSIKKGEVLQEDLLTFGPDMGVTVGSSFSRRYAEDEMHLHLDSEGSYSLMLSGAVPADQGMYVCTARQWTREQGDWKKIQEKTAVMGDVTVIPTGGDRCFSVVFVLCVCVSQYPGDPTELVCQVRNISHLRGERLGVSWFYSSSTNEPLAIASMDANGALMPGEKYQSSIEAGLIVVSRVEPIAFKLRLLHTTNVDAGEYACSITTWTTTHQGTWRKSSDHRSRTLKVSLPSKSPGLSVVARTVRQAISSGSTFEMSCQARPKNLKEGVALSVLISMQEGVGSPSHKLASISPDLVFKVEDQHEHSKQDSLSLVKTGREEFLFRIRGVQATDRGFYSCEVVAWIMQNGSNWVEVVKGDSNKIQLTFEHKRPIFDLSINVFTTSVLPWETVKMECIVSVLGTPTNTGKCDVAYEIRWYQSWGSDTVTLLASMDRWGVVKKSPRNDSSDCSLERLRAEMFVLNIHGTQESDAGEYFCTASPWMRSTTTGVWSRELDVTSKRVFLHVKFAFWDSMKFPLLYGACASLFVGLFSLILGLICAQCCLRDTTHSPRSRVKLMDLEID
uniref:Ig-like domain-containing protein n=1 Tax=Electrophorus electricus TaxID=8005 RepID=A0A4W4FJU6_ELEEL